MTFRAPNVGFRTKLPARVDADGVKRKRECLLFRVYRNMRGRAHGGCTKAPWTYVLGWPDEWNSYAAFRAWALRSGFTKATPSPDRERTDEPYGPNNVIWRPVRDNQAGARGRRAGAQPDGPEPPQPETFTEWQKRRHRTGSALDVPDAPVPF